MVLDLKEIIDHLNTTNSTEENTDPVSKNYLLQAGNKHQRPIMTRSLFFCVCVENFQRLNLSVGFSKSCITIHKLAHFYI